MGMKVLYEESDFRKIFNKSVENEIAESEKLCTPFPINCHQRDGVWGIWFQIEDDFLLVNPVDLVSSIFKDDDYDLLEFYIKDTEQQDDKISFSVNICCKDHAFHWKLSHSALAISGKRSFTFEEYLNKTKMAIDRLYQVWSENEHIAYDKYDVELDAVEMCKKQMEIKAVMPDNSVLKNADVHKESFVFHPVECDFYEEYTIGIGNRKYNTYLTDWDNNLERIRHQLETYLYEEDASVKLYFDMSETVVIIKKESVLDNIVDDGEGCYYKYKDYALVEIHPNEFVHKPIVKGYCDIEETIRTFYEGLLRHAMRLPMSDDNRTPNKMDAYNMIKSPLIESYLRKDKVDNDTYSIRQVHVKHILTIEPDMSQLFFDEEMVSYDSFDGLYDKEGKPFEMSEFVEWHKEIEQIVVASEMGESYEKDWEDYHRRGLRLAKSLRDKLSSDFDLWYDVPFEDKSKTIEAPILII